MIRVAVVEDQSIVREGLKSLIELADGMTVVAEAADGLEALTALPRARADVVLLDIRMPRLDGIGVLEKLGELGCLPPTLVLTTFDDHDVVFAALRAGAKGFLLKDVSLAQLTAAIRTLADGGTLVNPAITARVLASRGPVAERARGVPAEPLTRRELEILRLIAAGYSNREIAEALGVAEGTVKNHTSHILAKLGVRDRTRAVLRALEHGLL